MKRRPNGAHAGALLASALLVLAGCGAEVLAQPPALLSQTGLYADLATKTVAADALPYTPQYPLWSDGAHKRRWIRLPPGEAIDGGDQDRWEFPAGTKLWKEFAFDRPVETRYMELRRDGTWLYATYAWSADGSDAALAPEAGIRGAWRSAELRYDIPSRTDCRLCHEGGLVPVLGFSALQLSPDRDPLAPHAETPATDMVDLAALRDRRLLRGTPDGTAPRIAARTPRERAALGYLHANCGSCHNDRGPLVPLELHLDWRFDRAEPGALASGCGHPSRFCPTGHDPADTVRIHPGDPRRSVLAIRLGSRDPLTQMPPLATRSVDAAALELLTAWIREDLAEPFSPSLSPPRVVERQP